jgi:hypothetical protein
MWNWKWIKLYLLVLRAFPLQERVCIASLWPDDPNTLYTDRCVWFMKSLSLHHSLTLFSGCSRNSCVYVRYICTFWVRKASDPVAFFGHERRLELLQCHTEWFCKCSYNHFTECQVKLSVDVYCAWLSVCAFKFHSLECFPWLLIHIKHFREYFLKLH